jgi:hypothetical protein
MSDQEMSPAAVRVLRTLRTSSMDGYTLQSEAQVESPASLAKVVRMLFNRGWVSVVGDITEQEIGRAFMHVPLQARGTIEEFLRQAPDM